MMLVRDSWEGKTPDLEVNEGLHVMLGAYDGKCVGILINSTGNWSAMHIPREYFDQMVDKYASIPELFWVDSGDCRSSSIPYNFGPIGENGFGLWALTVSVRKASKDDPEIKEVIVMTYPGCSMIASLFTKADFDRIVDWYNSEVHSSEKAA
jgi:hypothetical protein